MKKHIIYSTDVNIEDHSDLVVFKNNEGEEQAIWIARFEEEGTFVVYGIDLYKKPSDSWISSEDLDALNEFADKKYVYDQEFTNQFDKYSFAADMCSYFGAMNYDNWGTPFPTKEGLEDYLKALGLVGDWVKVRTVMMSHLSDAQMELNIKDFKAQSIEKLNFVKHLLMKYPDTSVEIDADHEYKVYQDGITLRG